MNLLRRITIYCKRENIPERTFGRLVMGDPRFVADLWRGREIGEKTRRKLDAYLSERNA